MESFNPRSFFQNVKSRELHGFRVRKRPFVEDLLSGFTESGALSVEHDGDSTIPLAISFCKTSKNSHFFAVSDEDGYVSLFDSRKKFARSECHSKNTEKARIGEWLAHQNAIFDLCWIKDDRKILTASGDQTVKVWDAEEKNCTEVLAGHVGSVKSMCPHPSNSDVVVSGSRDGSFALWDLRCKTSSISSRHKEFHIGPTATVNDAHSTQVRRTRRAKAASTSVTSVLYLKDEVSIATAGAANSMVKFWDVRNLKAQVTQASPGCDPLNNKERRLHGISSMSQDANGVFLAVASTDSSIYLYNVLQLDKGPLQTFTGSRIESFFIKSVISPDASHILSGSTDGNAYVWKVSKPHKPPVLLKSHEEDVTAVDWCQSDVGKVLTASDDFTVRVWNIENSYHTSTRSPSSIRRRVMAVPNAECRRLLFKKEQMDKRKVQDYSSHSTTAKSQISSFSPITMPIMGTPESRKKKVFTSSESEACEKTPEATFQSPASVLSPPSSLKRKTIKDYFLAAS